MKLNELLADIGDVSAVMNAEIHVTDINAEISGITDNTESVGMGCIFVCVKGSKFDGHSVAADMLAKGAVCVVAEHDTGVNEQIIVRDSRAFYGLLCAKWFGHPEKKLKLVGVTGTNGKTTMATLIKEILAANGRKVAFIGTTGVLINGKSAKSDGSTPTTPRVNELYRIFAEIVEAGCDTVVMEVSSFALEQNRIGPAVFDTAVFTNLTQDHLDYHITMENYYQAKKLLFTRHCKTAIVNIDDSYGKRLYNELKEDTLLKNGLLTELISYGLHDNADAFGDNIRTSDALTKFWISIYNKSFPVSLSMIGTYNVSNAIAAICACLKCGTDINGIIAAVNKFKGVRGRCEILTAAKGFMVVCDYAHSPDALENMLPNIKEHTSGRLICLFGCGGDRDKTKRPLMAAAAEKYADMLVITSDNPRSEEPDAIIDDIAAGINGTKPYIRITDRKAAIKCAIMLAEKGDTIVLAGKGHENYQILKNDVHIHFDEREIVAEIMKSYSKTPFNRAAHELMSFEEIALVTGGTLKNFTDTKAAAAADMIFSDTRKIVRGGLFAAIKGENFDGNDFAEYAVENGAAAAIVSREAKCPCIVVEDTRKALLALARYYRLKFKPVVVGITGSVGKTTTKNMTALALSSGFGTMKTEGNRNNEIGLPFTLFRLNSTFAAAVIEMGMSDYGEIERLSGTAVPTVCMITNIGFCHIEKLRTQEGILKAKLEIIKGAENGAPLIINADDKLLFALKDKIGDRKIICYGIENKLADYTAQNVIADEKGISFDFAKNGNKLAEVKLSCIGIHNALNALAAMTAAVECGCNASDAAEMLLCYKGDALRQNICKIGNQTIIKDCYNASPTSVMAAIDTLCDIKTDADNGARRVAVLGDMLELGENSPEYHEKIGEYAAKKGIDKLICYGKMSKFTAKKADELGLHAGCTEDKGMLLEYLKMTLRPNDTVLFKASRGMKLEEVIDELYTK